MRSGNAGNFIRLIIKHCLRADKATKYEIADYAGFLPWSIIQRSQLAIAQLCLERNI